MTGKRALVTGGSRGIGAAVALRLAEEGADVAFTYVSSEEVAAEVAGKIEALGRRALALRAVGWPVMGPLVRRWPPPRSSGGRR